MRVLLLFGSIFLMVFLTYCGKDEINLPQQVITGKMAGKSWDLKFANAYLYSSDLKYRIQFLSTREFGDDACAVPSTGNPYLSIIIEPRAGSYSLPLPINEQSCRFNLSPGNFLIATSGFLEIFDVTNSRIFGYIQAVLDDDNTVEGSFEAMICN